MRLRTTGTNRSTIFPVARRRIAHRTRRDATADRCFYHYYYYYLLLWSYLNNDNNTNNNMGARIERIVRRVFSSVFCSCRVPSSSGDLNRLKKCHFFFLSTRAIQTYLWYYNDDNRSPSPPSHNYPHLRLFFFPRADALDP